MDFLKLKTRTNELGQIKPCIICKNTKFEIWAKLDVFTARKCKKCGMISVNPIPTQEHLDKFYDDYLIQNKKERKLWEQRKIAYKIDKDWITKFLDHGKVLDVGCSGGQFLSYFDPKKWARYGVEVDDSAVEYAKKNYGIAVRKGNITELTFNEKFDLVMMRGVVEHFANPITVLKKCSSLLKKGGFLFITATPSGDSFAFDVYREKWGLFSPPGHIHFFTVDLLSRILKKNGLILVDHHYQYAETPYANPQKDFEKIKNDINLIYKGKRKQVKESVPFPGSMMTAVWKKTK